GVRPGETGRRAPAVGREGLGRHLRLLVVTPRDERPAEPQLALAPDGHVLPGLWIDHTHLDALGRPHAGDRSRRLALVEVVEQAERVELRHAIGLIGLRDAEGVDDVLEEAVAAAPRHAEPPRAKGRALAAGQV